MKKYNKNQWLFGLFLVITGLVIVAIVLAGIPLSAQWLINKESNQMGSDDGWLGFWGGYLGAIIGVVGAVLVLQVQSKKENKARKIEKIDNTFFNLLELHNRQHDQLINKDNVFEQAYEKIKKQSSIQCEKQRIEYILKSSSQIEKHFENLITNYEQLIQSNIKKLPESASKHLDFKVSVLNSINDPYYLDDFSYVDDSPIYHTRILYTKLYDASENIKKMNAFSNRLAQGGFNLLDKTFYPDFKKHLDEIILKAEKIEIDDFQPLIRLKENLDEMNTESLRHSIMEEVVESVIDEFRIELGAYFRIFHRIVKYINANVNDEIERQEYIGFLRANINETEILILFYNAIFTERGLGLHRELSRTSFFGKPSEFEDGKKLPFANEENLIRGKTDKDVMSNLSSELKKRSH